MITFMHGNGQGRIGIEDGGSISVFVEGDDTLLKLLQEEAVKGISYLKSFKTKGIPGKYKAFRKVENNFEIVTFLKSIQNMYPNYEISIQKRYTLLKWNGEYGANAKFIVIDNYLAQQSLFTPRRCEDLFWFHVDLAKDQSVSSWEEFGEESFDDLESIAI